MELDKRKVRRLSEHLRGQAVEEHIHASKPVVATLDGGMGLSKEVAVVCILGAEG